MKMNPLLLLHDGRACFDVLPFTLLVMEDAIR